MNQETNNEIDLLLRKLGRQGVSASTDSPDAHLDADELNMYAENVLTSKTRARYTQHLADCTRCRQLVSQLSMAAGLVVREKKTEVPAATGIKALLASFFSPMVLRYAVPALGLVVVASIGFLVLRDSTMNKQNASAERAVALNSPISAEHVEDSQRANLESKELADRTNAGTATTSSPRREATPPAKANDDGSTKESNERKRDEPAKTTDQVASAPATASASATPIPKPPAAVDSARAGQDVAEKKKQQEEETAAAADAVAKRQAKAEEQQKLGAAGLARVEPGTKSAPSRSVQQRARQNEADERRGRADKDAETRSVAGRQFRREGSTWIDIAYSSQATTNVARGSEQFRALIADEPALKTISDQLGGEVIVVWKGRAYRIR